MDVHAIIEGEIGFVIKAKGYLLTLEGLPSARVNTVIINGKGSAHLLPHFGKTVLKHICLAGAIRESVISFS